MITAAIRAFCDDLSDAFWLIPALMTATGVLGALVLASLEADAAAPLGWIAKADWLYRGGAANARELLGTVAGATIGVAGTVFSITIAALSLAAGQMGHHLLRNFTRDRGNQGTLGMFLMTFAYATVLLHSLPLPHDDAAAPAPRLSLTLAVALALLCVATLVWFVGHMAGRINVETVVSLVNDDATAAIRRLTSNQPPPAPPERDFWAGAALVLDPRRGYLHHVDNAALADWAAAHGTTLRLLLRPGDYLFPGTPIALAKPPVEGAAGAIREATAFGRKRISADDLRYAMRELVEVAVRALSPAINSPNTALDVLDRLGANLCQIAPRHLPSGVTLRDGRPALVLPGFDYASLSDLMFNMIRQYGANSPVVLNRMLEVLTAVAAVETEPARLEALQRHAARVLVDAEREIGAPDDLEGVRRRHRNFTRMRRDGAAAFYGAAGSVGAPPQGDADAANR